MGLDQAVAWVDSPLHLPPLLAVDHNPAVRLPLHHPPQVLPELPLVKARHLHLPVAREALAVNLHQLQRPPVNLWLQAPEATRHQVHLLPLLQALRLPPQALRPLPRDLADPLQQAFLEGRALQEPQPPHLMCRPQSPPLTG